MPTRSIRVRLALGLGLLGCVAAFGSARAAVQVVDARFVGDVPFPRFMPLWTEGWAMKDAAGQSIEHEARLGGYLHVYVRNTGPRAVRIEDVLLETYSLARVIAFSRETTSGMHPASIRFAGLDAGRLARLIELGEPVWWRVDPPVLAPGGFGEATVRLRHVPRAAELSVVLKTDEVDVPAKIRPAEARPRIVGAYLPASLDRLHLYLRRPVSGSDVPRRAFVDEADVTASTTFGADAGMDTAVAVVRLARPLERCSLHCLRVEYADGSQAVACLRATGGEFVYGMWGYLNKGDSPEERVRTYLGEMESHNINTLMYSIGGDVVAFLHSPSGIEYSRRTGIRMMQTAPNDAPDPVYLFLMDEPDASDYSVQGLERAADRLGSLAQPLVQRSREFREKDPRTPQILNVDNSYKPDNWYTYAQIPDIMCADPYFQEQQRLIYADRPGWLPYFTKPTYVYAVGTICQTAAAPRPLHLILNCVRHDMPSGPFRFATPEEKRIEAMYAVAAGAKALSYWWFTPYGEFHGCGSDSPEGRRLWTEIGLLGAELRTAGPVLTVSCPTNVPVQAPPRLWVRTLLGGTDAVVLVVANDAIACDRVGMVYKPVERATLAVPSPAWLRPADAFEITSAGVVPVSWKAEGTKVTVDLGTVEVSRLVIVTSDTGLRERLGQLYRERFAAKAAALLEARRALQRP